MSDTRYTQAEIEQRTAELLPSKQPATIEVGTDAAAVEGETRDTILRVLSGEQDAIYALASRFVREQLRRCTLLTAALDSVDRAAEIIQAPRATANRGLIRLATQALDDLRTAPYTEYEALSSRLNDIYMRMRAEAQGTGATAAGHKREYGVQLFSDALEIIIDNLPDLISSAEAFVGLQRAYAELYTYNDAAKVQAQRGVEELYRRYVEGETSPVDAVVDFAVFQKLLAARTATLDVGCLKYDGAVTFGTGTSAILTGNNLPITVAAGATVVPDATVGWTDNITADPAAPSLTLPLTDAQLQLTEIGAPIQGDGITWAFTPLQWGYLKTTIIPGTLTVQTVDVGGNPLAVIDNGAGVMVGAGAGVGVNTVDYVTGAVTVTWSSVPANLTDITFTYSYSVLGSGQDMVNGVAGAAWDEVKVYDTNTLTAVNVGTGTAINSVSDLAAVLLAADPAHGWAASAVGVGLSGVTGGTADRLMAPYRASLPARLNIMGVGAGAFGSPTWTTAPADINEAVEWVYSTQVEARGADVNLSDLTVGPNLLGHVTLSSSVETVLTRSSGTVLATDPDEVTVSGVDLSAVLVGDIVEVYSAQVSRHRVVAPLDPAKLTLESEVPMGVDTTVDDTLLATNSVEFLVTRSPLGVTSSTSGAGSSVVATLLSGDGLGLVGTAYGAPTSVTLATEPARGMRPRRGDLVAYAGENIGTVTKYDGGTEVAVNIAWGSVVPPVTSCSIQGLGQSSYQAAQSSVAGLPDASLPQLLTSNIFSEVLTNYAAAGADRRRYDVAMEEARAYVAAAVVAYKGYAANKVTAVARLLSGLKEDRKGTITAALEDLRLTDAVETRAQMISEQGELATLLGRIRNNLDIEDATWSLNVADLIREL